MCDLLMLFKLTENLSELSISMLNLYFALGGGTLITNLEHPNKVVHDYYGGREFFFLLISSKKSPQIYWSFLFFLDMPFWFMLALNNGQQREVYYLCRTCEKIYVDNIVVPG